MVSSALSFADMNPSPRVRITIDPADLDASTDTVTVLQMSKWGEFGVRDAVKRPLLGGFVVEDYEDPIGAGALTYRVEMFDTAGSSLGFALNLVAPSPSGTKGYVILQDPLVPENAVRVRAEFMFADVLRRSRPTKLYQAGGRTFVMSGVMSGLQRVNMRVVTETAEDRDMLDAVLTSPIVLVRTRPEMRLPGVFYATVAEIPMVPFDAAAGGDTDVWDLVGDEVTRPTSGVVSAVYSYDLFKTYLDSLHPPTVGTYADAAAEWSSYVDALRFPPTM